MVFQRVNMLTVLSVIMLCYKCVVAVDTEPQCSTSTLKLSVESCRNQTGHLVSQVGLVQDTLPHRDGNNFEPWQINIEHRSIMCSNKEQSLETKFFLTAPHSTPTLSAQKAVPKGYELFRGVGYYKFHTQVTTWPLALQTCAEESAHLAIINSDMEDNVMRTLFGRYPTIQAASNNDWAWIGLQRIGENYFTIFGDALETTGFQRWSKGEPHRGTSYCGLVGRADGAIADHLCDWKVAFICEFDPK